MPSNLDFYRRREQEERAHADRAQDSRIGTIHLEMVSLYARLIALESEEPLLKQVG
jgi:hypothetical protein